MKRGSTSLAIKTTMRYHLTSVRMAIISKISNNKCWRGCEEKNSHSLLVECILVQPPRKSLVVPQKIKNRVTYDPAIPVLSISPRNSKTFICKDLCTLCSLPHYSQGPTHSQETTKMAFDRGLDKEDVVNTYNHIYV